MLAAIGQHLGQGVKAADAIGLELDDAAGGPFGLRVVVPRALDVDEQERHAGVVGAIPLDRLEQIAGGVRLPPRSRADAWRSFRSRRSGIASDALANAAAASSQCRWRSATSARSMSARVNCGSTAITVSSDRAAPSRSPVPSWACAIR